MKKGRMKRPFSGLICFVLVHLGSQGQVAVAGHAKLLLDQLPAFPVHQGRCGAWPPRRGRRCPAPPFGPRYGPRGSNPASRGAGAWTPSTAWSPEWLPPPGAAFRRNRRWENRSPRRGPCPCRCPCSARRGYTWCRFPALFSGRAPGLFSWMKLMTRSRLIRRRTAPWTWVGLLPPRGE